MCKDMRSYPLINIITAAYSKRGQKHRGWWSWAAKGAHLDSDIGLRLRGKTEMV